MTATRERMRWWHLPEVAALEGQLFPVDPWSSEQFWQELAQPTRHYVVATDDSGVLGYAGAFISGADADVQTVGVRGERQGGGVATGLLGDLFAESRRRGATHMLLEVRSDNSAAIALYERLGFVRISERPRYYPDGCSALVMRLNLAARREERP
jgi:ribosomal-protein-alanine N-acetyltransferase